MHTHAAREENRLGAEDATPAGIVVAAVGLLADFLALRDGQTKIDLVEFIDWLRQHDHPDLAHRIRSNPALFDAFLLAFAEGHGQLHERINFLDEGLILLCGTDGAFAAIAKALRPNLAAKVHSR